MAPLPLATRTVSAWGAHAFGVLVSAFCGDELPQRSIRIGRPARPTPAGSSRWQNASARTPQACAPQHLIRRLLGPVALVLLTALTVYAQVSPSPSPTVTKSVRIRFLPPPLEGTISLGIYDGTGKLVRVLHREADLEEFEIGSDALSTTWDGKDDAGAALPPGKYHARGYVVGDVDVEGVGFFFNDWVTEDESPHLAKVRRMWVWNDRLVLDAQVVGAEGAHLLCDDTGAVTGPVEDFLPTRTCPESADTLAVVELVDCDTGKDETLWVIDRLERGGGQTGVKQFSKSGELIRQLTLEPGDPQPIRIAASKRDDEIFLLEENAQEQRLRRLELLATNSDNGRAISDWKVVFEKKITRHQGFTLLHGEAVVAGGETAHEKIAIKLPANPLEKDQARTIDLAVGSDAEGSFLKTADGLPLQRISETKNLTRIVLLPAGEKSIDVFQDDEAVVEHFRVSALDQMMAFDCGEIELK